MSERPERDLQGRGVTVLREPAWSTVGLYIVFVLLGTGGGWLAVFLADWLVTLPWAPMQGPAELVTSIPDPWLPAAGAVAGLAFGLFAQYDQLAIRLTDQHVLLTSRGRELEFPHDSVDTVFRDGRQLVLLGHNGGELARQECGLGFRRVADAFTAYDYTWADADPHKDEFRRWVPDALGLPEGANAILKARQELLKDEDPSDSDVQELREELARLGVVVRDEKKRQYWRTFRPSGPATQ